MITALHYLLTTRIADPSSDDAFGTSKLGLWEPKSGHGKAGLLRGHRGFVQRHGWATQVTNLQQKTMAINIWYDGTHIITNILVSPRTAPLM